IASFDCSILNSHLIEESQEVTSPFGSKLDSHIYDELPRTNESLQSDSSHKTDEVVFKCDICGKILQTSHSLKMHLRRTHGRRIFKCHVTGKYFSTSQTRKDHVRCDAGEKPFKCKTCGNSFSKQGKLRVHQRFHSNKNRFKCDTCGQLFPFPANLRAHIRTHTGEKPFTCDVCGKCYSHPGSLTVHLRTHTGEKPFKCDQCGKCFAYSGGVKEHLRSHTGDKPFKCDTFVMDVIKTEPEVDPLAIDPSENPDAEKPNPSLIEGTLDSIMVKEEIKWEVTSEEYEIATTESVLNTDLIETLKKVESPESCPSSENDAFGSRLDPLTDAHLQSDYSCQAHEALFKCVICGEMLQDFTSLKKHRLRSHRVRTSRCNVCGECFSTKLYLRYHNIRSHAGEEPFTCKICGIGFLTSGNFQNHQPKQSDKIVRVFQCETCGKQFSTPGTL
ncbi:hypothetical protein ANN_27515, partial [Periplaneta americana]